MPLGLTPAHLILILVIALIVVGPGRLPEVGSALGKSIKEFRKAASDIQESTSTSATSAPATAAAPVPAPLQAAPAPAPVQAAPVAAPMAPPPPPAPAAPVADASPATADEPAAVSPEVGA